MVLAKRWRQGNNGKLAMTGGLTEIADGYKCLAEDGTLASVVDSLILSDDCRDLVS